MDGVDEAAVLAVRSGDTAALARALAGQPGLATARLPGHGGRTLLHVACDWPGHLPNVAESIAVLVRHGADVDAAFVGAHRERPLHWAASADDVEAVDALLDAGADIDAPGAVVGGGTPLNDATAFAQWRAARRLVERGAAVSAWDAAALGLTDDLATMVGEDAHDLDAPPVGGLPRRAPGHRRVPPRLRRGREPGRLGRPDAPRRRRACRRLRPRGLAEDPGSPRPGAARRGRVSGARGRHPRTSAT